MQQWRKWQPEALAHFAMGVCLLFAVFSVTASFFQIQEVRKMNLPIKNLQMLILHSGLFLLVGLFLKEQKLSWQEGFGIRFGRLSSWMLPALATAILCWFCAHFLGKASAIALETWTGKEPAIQDSVKRLQESTSAAQVLFLALITIVMAPVAEETLFRGVLHTALSQHCGRAAGIWGNAILFGIIHWNVLSLIPLTVMAVFLTLLYEHTRNLLAPILAHALFNLATFTFILMNRT